MRPFLRGSSVPASLALLVSCAHLDHAPQATLSDDFEGYAPGGPPGAGWQVQTGGGGTLVVDDTQAFSGTRSVHIKVPRAVAKARIRQGRPVLPLPGNNLHGRMMVRLTPGWSGDHTDLVSARGMIADGAAAELYVSARPYLFVAYHPHHCTKKGKTNLPLGRWVCLQWQFDGSRKRDGTAKNEVRVWIDGALVNDAVLLGAGGTCREGVNPPWVVPVFDSFSVGWQNWNNAMPVPVEMWIDDVAIDSKAIACPANR
jgi:hypothetical protein